MSLKPIIEYALKEQIRLLKEENRKEGVVKGES